MTLDAASAMRRSASLKGRIESSAYAHGQSMQWVDRNLPALCATAGWAEKWTTAYTAAVEDGDPDRNIGISRSVIGDDMIDEAVVALIAQDPAPSAVPDSKVIADLQLAVQQQATQIADLQAKLDAAAPVDAGTQA